MTDSHLFDFAGSWIYVLGVGIAGGMALAAKKMRIQCVPKLFQRRPRPDRNNRPSTTSPKCLSLNA